MKLQIFIMLISSFALSFFFSVVICYALAKVTSMPSRKINNDVDKLAGATYRAKVDNIKMTPKLSTLKVANIETENGVKSNNVSVKDLY